VAVAVEEEAERQAARDGDGLPPEECSRALRLARLVRADERAKRPAEVVGLDRYRGRQAAARRAEPALRDRGEGADDDSRRAAADEAGEDRERVRGADDSEISEPSSGDVERVAERDRAPVMPHDAPRGERHHRHDGEEEEGVEESDVSLAGSEQPLV